MKLPPTSQSSQYDTKLPPTGLNSQEQCLPTGSSGGTIVSIGGGTSAPSSNSEEAPALQYANVAASQEPCQIQGSKRHRRSNYRDQKDTYVNKTATYAKPTQNNSRLSGAYLEPLSHVYVCNTKIKDNDNDETITSMIRGYCCDNGVKVVRVRVIYNRYNEYIVGCKLSVATSQKGKLISEGY